jgi:hypothetical protein
VIKPLAVITAPVTAPLALGDAIRELLDALRVLPTMAEDVRLMREAVQSVARDAAVLPDVAAATARLDEIETRMGKIAGTMPEVEELRDILTPLPATMAELLPALGRLHETTLALGVALEPIGRVADRLPGGGRKSGKNGD